jgi:uncharacterized damage-inducible protein DinB
MTQTAQMTQVTPTTPAFESIVNEFRHETATTKRVLDRIPADKLTWRPHPKSMSLGVLAMHIATVPGNIVNLIQTNEVELNPENFTPPTPKNLAEIHSAMDRSAESAEKFLSELDDKTAYATWRLMSNGREIFAQPRIGVVRAIMLNHWYHHRGQLSVYLRLLNVPVPSIYGPSADENPFA